MKKITISLVLLISLLMVLPSSSILAEENNETGTVVLRAPTRNFSKDYSYGDTRARLDITYTIDQATGNIKEIVSAGVTRLSGDYCYLEFIEISGPNTVFVGISLGQASQIDYINLY